jgi:FkbM family methyltransferase
MSSAGVLDSLDKWLRPILKNGRISSVLRSIRKFLEAKGWANLTVTIDGVQLTGGLTDRGMLRQLEQGRLEPLTLKLWTSAIAPDMNVIDLGAYIGVFTMLASRQSGESGHVWAVEPNAISRALLQKNIARNHLNNVTVWDVAASNTMGHATLSIRAGDRTQSTIGVPNKASDSTEDVATGRMDDMLPEGVRIDAAKIDTEGSETSVLLGMTRCLESMQMLIVESNAGALRNSGSTQEELHELLRSAGFTLHVIDDWNNHLHPFTDEFTSRSWFNILATRPGSPASQRLGLD